MSKLYAFTPPPPPPPPDNNNHDTKKEKNANQIIIIKSSDVIPQFINRSAILNATTSTNKRKSSALLEDYDYQPSDHEEDHDENEEYGGGSDDDEEEVANLKDDKVGVVRRRCQGDHTYDGDSDDEYGDDDDDEDDDDNEAEFDHNNSGDDEEEALLMPDSPARTDKKLKEKLMREKRAVMIVNSRAHVSSSSNAGARVQSNAMKREKSRSSSATQQQRQPEKKRQRTSSSASSSSSSSSSSSMTKIVNRKNAEMNHSGVPKHMINKASTSPSQSALLLETTTTTTTTPSATSTTSTTATRRDNTRAVPSTFHSRAKNVLNDDDDAPMDSKNRANTVVRLTSTLPKANKAAAATRSTTTATRSSSSKMKNHGIDSGMKLVWLELIDHVLATCSASSDSSSLTPSSEANVSFATDSSLWNRVTNNELLRKLQTLIYSATRREELQGEIVNIKKAIGPVDATTTYRVLTVKATGGATFSHIKCYDLFHVSNSANEQCLGVYDIFENDTESDVSVDIRVSLSSQFQLLDNVKIQRCQIDFFQLIKLYSDIKQGNLQPPRPRFTLEYKQKAETVVEKILRMDNGNLVVHGHTKLNTYIDAVMERVRRVRGVIMICLPIVCPIDEKLKRAIGTDKHIVYYDCPSSGQLKLSENQFIVVCNLSQPLPDIISRSNQYVFVVDCDNMLEAQLCYIYQRYQSCRRFVFIGAGDTTQTNFFSRCIADNESNVCEDIDVDLNE